MKSTIILLCSILFFTFGCTDNDDNGPVRIRIKNNSTITFDTVQVGAVKNVYSDIEPGQFSSYLTYETAYTYNYIEIVSGDEVFVLQPIDFVGETPLEMGFYTYELDVTETGNVSLNFVVD